MILNSIWCFQLFDNKDFISKCESNLLNLAYGILVVIESFAGVVSHTDAAVETCAYLISTSVTSFSSQSSLHLFHQSSF